MGMIEVEAVGTGFMKISRSALERIRAARPDLERADYTRFFWFNDQDGGEDYEFCALARSVGLSIWADPTIDLKHVGDKEYTGKFADLITFGAGLVHEPVADAAE